MTSTIHDVAQKAGVSISTVSAVVNSTKYVSPGLRKRVELAIAELDYIPNHAGRALSSKRTHTLAYVIPTIASAFNPLVIEAVEETAAKHGYGLIVCNTERDPDRARRAQAFVLGAHVDGVIVSPTAAIPDELVVQPYLKRGIPTVLLAGPRPFPDVDSFITGDERGTEILTRYLIDAGHERIWFVGRNASSTTEARLAGVRKVMQEAGLPMPEEYVKRTPEVSVTHAALMEELLHLPSLPTAIICHNDSVALEVIRACYDLKLRVPEDISVTGYDDTLGSVCIPPLTTLSVPAKEMGRLATESLINRIESKTANEPPRTYRFMPELVVRASSGPPRKQALTLT